MKRLAPIGCYIENGKIVRKPRKGLAIKSKSNSGRKRIDAYLKIKPELLRDAVCEMCGAPAVDLNHILYRTDAPQLIDEPLNLMPMCRACHDEAHASKRRYYVWLEVHRSGLLDRLRMLARERGK